MDVSANRHTPKSSILIGFSIINHPFWGTPIFGNTQMIILGCEMGVPPFEETPTFLANFLPSANLAHENRPLPTGTCHFSTIKFRVLSQCHREDKKLTQHCFGKNIFFGGRLVAKSSHSFPYVIQKIAGIIFGKRRNKPIRVWICPA